MAALALLAGALGLVLGLALGRRIEVRGWDRCAARLGARLDRLEADQAHLAAAERERTRALAGSPGARASAARARAESAAQRLRGS